MSIDFDDFYDILLLTLMVLVLCFGAYFIYNDEKQFRKAHNYREINGIQLITVDGHDYIYSNRKTIYHYESCENPSHKK